MIIAAFIFNLTFKQGHPFETDKFNVTKVDVSQSGSNDSAAGWSKFRL